MGIITNKNKRYLIIAKKYRKYEIMIGILMLINSVIGLMNPLLYRIIIDRILLENQAFLIKYILIVFFVCFVLKVLIGYVSGLLSTYLGQIISIHLRKMLLHHILGLRLKILEKCKIGDLISRISEDVATIASFLSVTLISVCGDALNAVAVCALMFCLSPRLAVMALIITISQIFISKKFSAISKKNQQEIRECSALNLSMLNNIFFSIKLIKAYCQEKKVEKKHLKMLQRLKDVSFKNFNIGFSYGTIISIISFIGSVLMLIMGINEIIEGNMTMGSFFVFDSMMSSFSQFANQLVGLGVSIQSVIVASDRLNAVFDMETEDYSTKKTLLSYDIKIDNLEFSYTDENLYDDLTLCLEKGKAYAIVGKSGCGKSTLGSLLLNMYQPSRGSMRIGNVPIEDIGIKELRKKITIVFQEPIIINGTVEDNIRFGDYHASTDKVKLVANVSGLNDFVDKKLGELSTMLEENGSNLSVGQKQRICLARAILRDSEIYIFDETFSSMDAEIGTDVYYKIEQYLSKKTRIYISHNNEFVKTIHNKILIKDGKADLINL